MKKSIFRMLFSLIVIALIAGCSDDDSTNPDNSGNLGNLVGTGMPQNSPTPATPILPINTIFYQPVLVLFLR
ncbi:MAG: hypothetical protein H6629_13275 [Calditrichae bacterium]|nr:hypothetical protein [Calditrichia bacterium]